MFSPSEFKEVFNADNIKLYIPVNTTEYHTSRLQEAMRQNMYSASGATEETIKEHLDAIIELCNQTGELKTIRTDIAGIANALKSRTQYPIDAMCSIRMGCVLTFMELTEDDKVITEDPNKCEAYWLKKKMDIAMLNPDLYSFFFAWGVSNTAAYSNLLDTLKDLDYSEKRAMEIMNYLPKTHLKLSRI